jgi:tetratricopeptide (TPR) repeat protein
MSVVKLNFSILVVLAFAIGASAQDLGSSNKLFGGSKKPTPEKTAKKTPAASKPVAAKTKATPKPKAKPTPKASTAKASGPRKPATASSKTKFTEFKDAQPSKVEITVGKPQRSVIESGSSSEERYEGLIESGNAARDDRNYSAAESAYKSARVLKPKDPRATYGLGNLYSDQQRWEDAENAYRAALQIDPGNAIAHVALSYVLTQPIAAPDLADRYEEAEKVARKAIQLAPANALAFDQLGASLELRGLIGAETENAYRKAIQLDPGFAPAYAHLGRLLRRRGMKQESAAAYENAVKRSNDVATLILVAEVLQSEQRYAESEQLLQRALAGDPRNPGALLLLGRALMAQSKFVEAERALLSNLAVTANGFAGNSLLGSLYTRQGLFDRAESALLNAARTVSPLEKRGLSMQFESVGDGFMKTGNRRAAERVYRQAITFDAENQALVGKLSKAQRG